MWVGSFEPGTRNSEPIFYVIHYGATRGPLIPDRFKLYQIFRYWVVVPVMTPRHQISISADRLLRKASGCGLSVRPGPFQVSPGVPKGHEQLP